MKKIKRAMHFDFHTLPGITNFNEKWNATKFAIQLEDAHVKYINFFAKCNLGFAYYPTKVGKPYPGLKFDMLGETITECHKRGIGVSAYFNAALDHEHARQHREWCIVNSQGQVIGEDKLNSFSRVMCCNTGYRNYLTGMIKEVVTNYDVDGIFIDCLVARPCYGNECVEGMIKKGYDPLNDDDVLSFSKEVYIDILGEIKQITGDKNLFINGWRDFLLMPEVRELCTHAELECLPETWGFDFFAANAAYTRNLKNKVVFMTGRLRNWGDFGSLRNKESLENDMWDALMNCTEFSVGDHLHPAETIEPDLLKMIKRLYTDLIEYEKHIPDSVYCADIGVLTDGNIQDEWYQGVSRMLGELKYQFDFIDASMDFSKYNLIIIPDNIQLDSLVSEKISQYLKDEKSLLSTGIGGLKTSLSTDERAALRIKEYTNTGKGITSFKEHNLTDKSQGFALPDWGMEYCGIDTNTQGYYRLFANKDSSKNGFRWGMYQPGILLRQGKGECLSPYITPYFNRHWDGKHGFVYTPPAKETEYCAAVQNGKIIHICFKVFSAYLQYALKGHKELVKSCIEKLLPLPLVKCEELPSTARVAVTANRSSTFLHVKVSFAETRGQTSVIEEHQVLKPGTKISIKGLFKAATVILSGVSLPITESDGYTELTLPEINGYIMIKLDQ